MDYRTPKAVSVAQSVGGLTAAPPQCGEVERQAYIASSVISLEARVDDVLSLISNLEQRLSPILRPSSPQAAQNPVHPETGVKLADLLDNHCDRLVAAVTGLNDILGRIEL